MVQCVYLSGWELVPLVSCSFEVQCLAILEVMRYESLCAPLGMRVFLIHAMCTFAFSFMLMSSLFDHVLIISILTCILRCKSRNPLRYPAPEVICEVVCDLLANC